MATRLRVSLWGAIPAVLYFVLALWLIIDDRVHSPGGWINLSGLGTGIALLPIALPMEWLGIKFDHRNTLFVGVCLCACTLIVYRLGQLGGVVIRKVRGAFRSAGPGR